MNVIKRLLGEGRFVGCMLAAFAISACAGEASGPDREPESPVLRAEIDLGAAGAGSGPIDPPETPEIAGAGVSVERAQALFDRLKRLYDPDAAAHGNSVTFDLIESDMATAHGHRGNSWGVTLSDSFLSQPTLSEDVLALVLCHELGHVFGGFPFIGVGTLAAEGQADYFATKECLPRLFAPDSHLNAAAGATIDPLVRAQCDEAWPALPDQQLCHRIASVSQDFGEFLAVRNDIPAPVQTQRDSSVVSITNDDHPSLQCRSDTLLAGALCDVKFAPGVIPGEKEHEGWYTPASEAAAAQYSCTTGPGARPSCWFKPNGTRFECGDVTENGACAEVDGKPVVATCNPTHGTEYIECADGQICELIFDGEAAVCSFPEQDEQLTNPNDEEDEEREEPSAPITPSGSGPTISTSSPQPAAPAAQPTPAGTPSNPASPMVTSTSRPATPSPTPAPTTPAVTPAPTTPAVTPAPTTPAVTPAPTTPAVTPAPTTPAVTPVPTTPAVTPAPTTPAVTPAPTTPAVTPVPTNPPTTPEITGEEGPRIISVTRTVH